MDSEIAAKRAEPPATKPGVVVVHPGRQHVYDTVLAAQQAGMLQRFVTSYYWGSVDPLCSSVRRLCRNTKFEKALRRRWHPEIDSTLVQSFPVLHAVVRMARVSSRAVFRRSLPNLDHWADVRFDRRASRWLRSQPTPAIVHAFEGNALCTLKAARHRRARTVLDVPSAYEEYVREVNDERQRYDIKGEDRLIDRISLERSAADVVLVPSPYVARCLMQQGVNREKMAVIPYGADVERFAPANRQRDDVFRVLFVGRVGFRKGIVYLLEAWRRLSLPGAELVVAGGIDDEIRGLLPALPKNVRLVDHIPFSMVDQLYLSADVFALPSLSEGSALVVYEAMAAGLPVVVTPNCGAVARDGLDGYIVPIRDPEAIGERLLFLFNHPEVRSQQGASARQWILERYTWRHYRRRLVAAYYALMHDRPIQEAVDRADTKASESAAS